MSLKFSPCGRLSLLRFARNCKQRSSLGTKISAQHSNSSQNTSPCHFCVQICEFRLFLPLGEEGVLLTKRRPFLSQALSNPTARSRRRHCFACAKRRKFKFTFSRCGSRRVNLKFTRKICLKRHFFVAVIVADML